MNDCFQDSFDIMFWMLANSSSIHADVVFIFFSILTVENSSGSIYIHQKVCLIKKLIVFDAIWQFQKIKYL